MIFLFSNCSTVNPCYIYNKEKIVHKIIFWILIHMETVQLTRVANDFLVG